MTAEEAVHLNDLQIRAEGVFAEAAERQRAYDAWAGNDSGMPMGVESMVGYAEEAVVVWRAEADRLGVLVEAPEEPDPVEGEPDGLNDDLSLLYRQFAAQVAAV